MIRKLVPIAAVAAVALMTSPGVAQAEDGLPEGLTVQVADCQVTIQAEDLEHLVSSGIRTAGLAVRVDGQILAYTEPAPADNGPATFTGSLTVGPFETDTTVEFRWFAGPERTDLPAWDTAGHPDWVEVVNQREADKRSWWDAGDDAPFVTWFEVEVPGCPADEPEPTPTPTEPEPTPAPSNEPTPAPAPTDDDTLPVTSGLKLIPVLGVGAVLSLVGAILLYAFRKVPQ